MSHDAVPQPHPDRLTPFAGHAVVVGVTPEQPELVLLTAASLARATGGAVRAAYVDPQRTVLAEHPDGTVTHTALDPDAADDDWEERERWLRDRVAALLGPTGVPWTFAYLAGRTDRALTHLARAADAAALVVGSRSPGAGSRVRELLRGSVAAQLAHHQHRPVLTVPLDVVDWKVDVA